MTSASLKAPRILNTEDEDVSAAVAFRAAGVKVREDFGAVESFENIPSGVRMVFTKKVNVKVPRLRWRS